MVVEFDSSSTSREIVRYRRSDYMRDGTSIHLNLSNCYQPTPLHIHEFYEIAIIVAGKGGHVYGSSYDELSPGDVLFINPTIPHQFVPHRNHHISCVTIAFTETVVESVLAEPEIGELIWRFFAAGQSADRCVPRVRMGAIGASSRSDYIMSIVTRMLDEYKSKAPGHTTILKGSLHVLLTELWRLSPGSDQLFGDATWQRILPAIHALYKTPGSIPTVEELAAMTGWSVNHFSKLFRMATGQNPSHFALRLRAQQAATLLMTTDDSIAAIAARTGYTDARSMRRAFIKCFGITPSDYRNRRRLNLQPGETPRPSYSPLREN